MSLETKLTHIWADHVLSKFIDFSKYDNNPELANKHYKRFEVTSFLTLFLLSFFLVFSNIFIVKIISSIITFFILVSYVTLKRTMFEKNLLEMTELEKERYRAQQNNSIALILVTTILTVIIFLVLEK